MPSPSPWLVRHGDDTDVGLDGAERDVGGLRLGIRETVEECGLADVGQSYDTALERHGCKLMRFSLQPASAGRMIPGCSIFATEIAGIVPAGLRP